MNNHPSHRMAAVLFAALALLACLPSAPAADPTNLRCEYLANPLGIDVEKPRLSWVIDDLKSASRGESQTAYQILVASSEALLKKDQGDLWDSGKVVSEQSIHLEYVGKPPVSCQPCFWKVRVWTQSTLNPEPRTLPARRSPEGEGQTTEDRS